METTTDPAAVLAELIAREPLFHRAEPGATRDDFARLISDDFWEIGASGRRYTRAFVLDELEKRHAAPHEDVWATSDFQVRKLGENSWLLTYTLLQDRVRLTRRATIWQQTTEGWKAVYHQGTIVEDS